MKIKFIKIGKVNRREIASLVDDYQKRMRPFCSVESLELKDPDASSKSVDKEKSKTNDVISELKSKPGTFVILLDERGRQKSSPNLAQFLENQLDNPQVKQMVFVVGGAYGFSEVARRQSDFIWSLSEGVFPNEIAWLLVWEQVYRAFNIIKGTPYHHE